MKCGCFKGNVKPKRHAPKVIALDDDIVKTLKNTRNITGGTVVCCTRVFYGLRQSLLRMAESPLSL